MSSSPILRFTSTCATEARLQIPVSLASSMVVPRRVAAPSRSRSSRLLAAEYPGTASDLCALHHDNPFQLLVATILSAQCTDERVNMTTPALFAAYPTPADLAAAPFDDLEGMIRSTGFFRAKARNLVGMATALVERFGGEVPTDMDDLTTLPGVGRKTANVVRSVAFGLPGLPVDTHVGRLARRLGLTKQLDPVKVESDLDAIVPESERGVAQHQADPARQARVLGTQSALRSLRACLDLPLRGHLRSGGNPEELCQGHPRDGQGGGEVKCRRAPAGGRTAGLCRSRES